MDQTNTPQPLSGRELLGIELNILRYPDPILKKPTEPVTAFDEELAGFVEKLYAAMRAHDGVGLAAPQVGVLKKIAVVEYEGKSYTLINPRVLEKRGELEAEEGCLSFPGIYAMVKRPEWVKIETQDMEGQTHVLEAEGFVALDMAKLLAITEKIYPSEEKEREALRRKAEARLADAAALIVERIVND